jgi:tRNA threonylcarbamoyladenosine biosynthesis protein TsaB
MIVALDASSTDLSVAILDADGHPLAQHAWRSAQRQSAELLPRLLSLVAGAGRRLDETRLLAVGTGPGSFTGLRVAMALAKGLAVGLGRPVVGVPSLEAWLESEPGARAAITRAGAHDGYVLARGVDTPVIRAEAEIARELGSLEVVAPSELAEAFGLSRATFPDGAAAAVGRLAARVWADHGPDAVAELEPLYLRVPRGLEGVERTWR